MARTARSFAAVGFVSAAAVAQLLLQFVLQVVLARYFGAGPQMDAYLAAFAIPAVLGTVLVGSLSYAFVPVFVERLQNAGPEPAWEMATTIGAAAILLSIGLSLAGYLPAVPLIRALYSDLSAEQTALAAGLLRILIWLTVTNSLVSFLYSIYHGLQRFFLPALASVIAAALTVVLTIYWRGALGIAAAAWAVLVSSALQASLLLPLFLRNLRPRFRVDEGTRRCFMLLLPLIAGAAYYKLDPLIDRSLASGLPTGSISHLGYAWRIATALVMIGTTGLSTVAFPALARYSAEGRFPELRAEIAHCWRFLAFVFVPVCVALAFFSRPLIVDLLQRGAFTSTDTRAVSELLVLYIGAIVAASVGEVLAKIFYSLHNTRTPTLITVVGFTIGLGLKLALIRFWGVRGLAVATSFYYLFTAAVMCFLIVRVLKTGIAAGLPGTLARALTGSLGAAAAAAVLLQFEFRFHALAAGALGLVVYCVAMWLLRDEFALRLAEFVGVRFQPHDSTE